MGEDYYSRVVSEVPATAASCMHSVNSIVGSWDFNIPSSQQRSPAIACSLQQSAAMLNIMCSQS